MNNNQKASAGRKTASQFHMAYKRTFTSCLIDVQDVEKLYNKFDGLKPTISSLEKEHDIYNLFIGVNIWLYLFEDITDASCTSLRNRILLCGLQNCISEADNYRKFIISDGTRGEQSSFWGRYYSVHPTKGFVSHVTNATDTITLQKELTNCLNLLGCLRRIRVEALDYTFMYQDYIDSNEKCRNWNKQPFIDYGSEDLWDQWKQRSDYYFTEQGESKPSFHGFFPSALISKDEWFESHPVCGEKILDDIARIVHWILEGFYQDTNLFQLPPGVTYEGAKTYLEKFKIVLRNQQWLREHGVNIPWYPVDTEDPADCNRYSIVPKNYDEGRGVAPEPVSRQVLGYQVAAGLNACLLRFGVDLTDQTINQNICRNAREYGFATVDKSKASDSISFELVKQLWRYDKDIFELMCACRTNFIQVNGKRLKNHRFCTMGNAITCPVQSIIYLAIGIYSESQCEIFKCEFSENFQNYLRIENFGNAFNCHDDHTISWRKPAIMKHSNFTNLEINDDFYGWYRTPEFLGKIIKVYNDDVVIPDWMLQTYVDIAEKLGFTINLAKTYSGKERYRESCGVEYYTFPHCKHSREVTSTIYPRGLSKYALPELVSLQHKYYDYSGVNGFLTGCIIDAFPIITTSEPGSDYIDIWSDMPVLDTVDVLEHSMLVHKYRVFPKVVTLKGMHLKERSTYYGGPAWFLTTNSSNIYHIGDTIDDRFIYWGTYLVRERGVVTQAEIHTTTNVERQLVKLSKDDAQLVELLAYYLSIGNGIKKINQSEYTRIENKIDSRIDLYCTRSVVLMNKHYK